MIGHIFNRFKNYAENESQSHKLSEGELQKQPFLEQAVNQPHASYAALIDAESHDVRNAMWCYLRAALRGDKEAQYKMGLSYLNGQLGLDRSYSHAEKWLDQAAHQGHLEAKQELQEAYKKLAFS
ncbi:SEL1-like repeat protein [Acinetobacter sp. ANC 3832]|uniref:SEL1-like repeat protein n=1 Tax=Acinetobacter sp. ANC 3832 TaxID=1977874 RepID=UPI000A357F9A|nr:SEL1-like repeat protein [Acinetobacter sp. ANC 3832]OTG95610.1 hypothetical protein B9T35_03455 [Acinetobacter sp. ANC 3832]